MSQENVKVVRAGFEAFARGDLESLLSDLHPEIEWLTTDDFIDEPSFRGQEGVRRLITGFTDVFDAYTFEAEDYKDFGDRVIVPVRQWGRGRESGIEVELRFVLVFTVQDGKLVRVESYHDESEALEAVGLAE
jgi:ketosteroid isomerase-like protein